MQFKFTMDSVNSIWKLSWWNRTYFKGVILHGNITCVMVLLWSRSLEHSHLLFPETILETDVSKYQPDLFSIGKPRDSILRLYSIRVWFASFISGSVLSCNVLRERERKNKKFHIQFKNFKISKIINWGDAKIFIYLSYKLIRVDTYNFCFQQV